MSITAESERGGRRNAYRRLVPYLGKILPAAIIRGVDDRAGRIHPLIEGIYKPANSNYAFSIASMLKSPYADKTFHNPDGSWWMWYAPKDGPLDIAANASLVRCMQDHEPVLALKQISDKTSRDGARHRLLGLADWFVLAGLSENRRREAGFRKQMTGSSSETRVEPAAQS